MSVGAHAGAGAGTGIDAGGGTGAASAELARLRHDLRTPLAVVAGFADLLAGERPLDERERRHFAGRIVEATNDLRRLLDDAAAA